MEAKGPGPGSVLDRCVHLFQARRERHRPQAGGRVPDAVRLALAGDFASLRRFLLFFGRRTVETLFQGLHQIEDPRLRRFLRLLGDLLAFDLALDLLHHALAHVVLVLLGVEVSMAAWSISLIARSSSGFLTSTLGMGTSAMSRISSA